MTAPVAANAVTQPLAAAGAASAAPLPPDMSITPPPRTDPAQPSLPPDAPGAVAAADPATAGPSGSPEPSIVIGAPVVTELPAGAIPCQPSICPAFDASGSVTNTQGNANPTEARGYLIAAGKPPSGDAAYPDLGNLPTLILPLVPVTVGAPAT